MYVFVHSVCLYMCKSVCIMYVHMQVVYVAWNVCMCKHTCHCENVEDSKHLQSQFFPPEMSPGD